jgi:hypothetical protein
MYVCMWKDEDEDEDEDEDDGHACESACMYEE